MSTETLEFAFDLAPENPRVSRFRYVRDSLQNMQRSMKEHGYVIRSSDAAKMLQCSPQRINELVGKGQLKPITIRDSEGEVLFSGVAVNSVLDYAKHVAISNPKGGRPKKEPQNE